jgi:uncharacterized membrane protein
VTYDSDPDFGLDSIPVPRVRSGHNDLAATIGLLSVSILVGLVLYFLVVLQLMGVDACSGRAGSCDFALLGATIYITPGAVVLVIAVTAVGLVARAKASMRSWWIPMLGLVVIVLAFVVASELVKVGLGV